MITASVCVLLGSLDGGWPARTVALASTVALMASRIDPLLLLAGAALFLGLRGNTGP